MIEIEVQKGVPTEAQVLQYKGGYLMYYRQANGFVAPASAQKMDKSNFIDSGWKPMDRYGQHLMNHVNIHRPLDDLFRKGGAKELPVKQVIEENYAFPIFGAEGDDFYRVDGQKVEFPQLQGADIPPLERCPFCPRKGRHEVIESHKEVQHQKDLGPAVMAEIISKAMRGESPTIEVSREAVQQAAAMPYICGQCMEGFKGHMQLAKHVKEHKNDSSV